MINQVIEMYFFVRTLFLRIGDRQYVVLVNGKTRIRDIPLIIIVTG